MSGFLEKVELANDALIALVADSGPLAAEEVLEALAVHTGWTILDDATATKANSTVRVRGAGSISFAKVNGSNHVIGGIYKSGLTWDLSSIDPRRKLVFYVYLSAVTDVVAVHLKLGTDASHHMVFTELVATLAAGWNRVEFPIYGITTSVGNGWNPAVIAYCAVGVEFSAEDKTLAGILVNYLSVEPPLLTV